VRIAKGGKQKRQIPERRLEEYKVQKIAQADYDVINSSLALCIHTSHSARIYTQTIVWQREKRRAEAF